MRIVVSGGGSAGHTAPALAVSDALKSLDSQVELLYVGQADGMEARIVAAAGMRFAAIKAGKFRRIRGQAGALVRLQNLSFLGSNVRSAGRVVHGLGASLAILRRFRPDVVFLKGGFVCVPVGLAARILRIPYVIHESDMSPGLANKFLGRWATKIAVGFPPKGYRDFDPGRMVFTGNPVRPGLLTATKEQGLAKFKLDPKLPVVLVTGGSQGAMQINDVVLEALPLLLPYCQVLHVTGEGDFERMQFELKRKGPMEHAERYRPYAFILKEMPEALAAADLMIGRAGAGTIAEAAALGKPTVLVPNYQMAAHQLDNAKVLARAGAVRVLDGRKLTAAQLAGEVKRVLEDTEEQGRLSRAIQAFGRRDAARELAEVILAVGGAQSMGRQIKQEDAT